MNRPVAAAIALLTLAPGLARPDSMISEQQARAKATDILKGDPYGRTSADVARSIKQVRLIQDGPIKPCPTRRGPAWEFHVVVVTANKDQFDNGTIDGYLALDARNGKFLCANLPMLD